MEAELTSGQPLTKREKKYIKAHHQRKFPSVIARELGVKYPEDNGGERTDTCVKRYVKKLVNPPTDDDSV